MSDDEADPELLALLRQHLGLGQGSSTAPPETKVLQNAQFVYDNSIDVALDMRCTQAAAELIWKQMQEKQYDRSTWSEHALHPKAKDEATVNFIFIMDLLNFSFWSSKASGKEFAVEWQGQRWTGYWSLVAALQRALAEDIPITSPSFWISGADHHETDSTSSTLVDLEDRSELGNDESTAVDHTEVDQSNAPSDLLESTIIPTMNGSVDPTEVAATNGSSTSTEAPAANGLPILTSDAHAVVDAPNGQAAADENITEGQEETHIPDTREEVAAHEQSQNTEKAPQTLTYELFKHIFRSATTEDMPLLKQRFECVREAGHVLCQEFDGSVVTLVNEANHSAAALVNLLANRFPCFRDEVRFEGKKVRFLKRAQIFVADLWAAFDAQEYGAFDDIDKITMFADYRIPQALQTLGCLWYSPVLESQLANRREIAPGHSWEVQIRGCTIWSIELIRREILKNHPEAQVNAILIDFFLYDTVTEMAKSGRDMLPHHRTRSIWY